jgi:hypothetical protein
MAHISLFVFRKVIIECFSAILVFLKLKRILGVSRQPPVNALGALPAQFGEQCLMLLPTADNVASGVICLMSLLMEQPGKVYQQRSSPQVSLIYRPMHPFSSCPPSMYGRQWKWCTLLFNFL